MVESTHRAAGASALLLSCILCSAEIRAQASNPDPGTAAQNGGAHGPPAPEPVVRFKGRVLCDQVIGVIGDQVILYSTIEEHLRALEISENKRWTSAEREQAAWSRLRDIARDEIWVQYGKVIGSTNPGQFKATIDRITAERMAEQEQRYGSFTRMTEELGNIGVSRDSVETEVRNSLLSEIGQWNALGQLSQRSTLMVTPRAMRRFFDENPELFAIQGEARFQRMWFSADEAGVEERMAAAALAWAEPGAEPDEIAERFGGRFRGIDTVIDAEDDPHAQPIRTFALGAEPGSVSAPILLGGTYRLLKLVERVIARDEAFMDPEVQNKIKIQLQSRRYAETRMKVIEKSSRKLLIWPPRLRRELMGR